MNLLKKMWWLLLVGFLLSGSVVAQAADTQGAQNQKTKEQIDKEKKERMEKLASQMNAANSAQRISKLQKIQAVPSIPKGVNVISRSTVAAVPVNVSSGPAVGGNAGLASVPATAPRKQ